MSSADFVKQMFNSIDTNGDGKISTDELGQMVAKGPQGGPSADELLKQSDTDGDGNVSLSEFEAATQNGPQMQGLQGGPMSTDDMFSAIDTNGDGTISKSEFEAAMGQNDSTTQADSTAQTDSSVQSGDSIDSLIKSLLEAVAKEEQTASSTVKDDSQNNNSIAGIAHLLSDALKTYMQSSMNGFSQGYSAQSLLGSNLYV